MKIERLNYIHYFEIQAKQKTVNKWKDINLPCAELSGEMGRNKDAAKLDTLSAAKLSDDLEVRNTVKIRILDILKGIILYLFCIPYILRIAFIF